MSFNLSISGHHNDPEAAQRIDDLVVDTARALVAEIRAIGSVSGLSATFSGPSGHVNFVSEADEAALNTGSGSERLGAPPVGADESAADGSSS